MKRSRARALIAVMSLVGGSVGGELAVRWLRPQPTFSRLDPMMPRMYRPSTVGPFELLPGADTAIEQPEFRMSIAINGQGLRMDREVAPRPAGPRIAVVGDSFTFGHGVEARDGFPAVTEKLLRAHGARDLEVLNLGFAVGASPDAYYAAFRRANRFEADTIVEEVFVGNDLTAGAETRWADLDERGLPGRVTHAFTRVDDEHRWRVRDTLLRYRLPLLRDSHLFVGLSRVAAGTFEASKSDYDEAYGRMTDRRLFGNDWPEEMARWFADSVRCVVGLRDLARSRGQGFLVLVIPTLEQVHDIRVDPASGKVIGRLRDVPADEVPQRRLEAALDAAGVPYLDLLPPLVAAHDPGLYYLQDKHFTARGHALAASRLAAEIERRGWNRREK